nr:transmembrane protein 276 [Anolis sagrei ordinatus]XP_060631990.1 transmembrane protein 276 [Anolis sagrei ordinatus]
MPSWAEEVLGLLSNLLLCATCLGSAFGTFQISRGASTGFLLQALVPLLDLAALVLPASLGLCSDPTVATEGSWVATVLGLPLLAFGFHWLHGDTSAANAILGGALLVAAAGGRFSEEGQALARHSATAITAVTILIISVFTGNAYGATGSFLVGLAGLLEGTLWTIWPKKDALRIIMSVANLALRRAFQTQQQELERGCGGLFASVSD